LNDKGYRNYKEMCYEAIYNDDQYYTFAWKPKMEIKDFIYQICHKETNFDQWKNMTNSKDNVKKASEFLSECNDPQFPVLKKDRGMFSFKNGVYLTNIKSEGKSGDIYYHDAFYEFGKHIPIDTQRVSCKYFDKEF